MTQTTLFSPSWTKILMRYPVQSSREQSFGRLSILWPRFSSGINGWILKGFHSDLYRPEFLSEVGCTDTSRCYQEGEKAVIVWKSNLLSFWINNSLKLMNIIVHFADSYPYKKSNPNSYHSFIFRKEMCCTCDESGECKPIDFIRGIIVLSVDFYPL